MMKKIFALVVLLVLGKMSYSQYPLQQNLGSDSTLVISKGALQSRLINVTYADTAAANLQRIRQYPGAQIATTTGGLNLWVRNANATAWVPVATGSGNNIYTIDGTLLGNRTLTGGTNSLTFQGLSNFKVTTTDSVRLANSQQYFILSDTLAKLERAGKATILVNSLNGGARIVLNPTGPADERKYEINAQNEEFWIAQISDSEALGDTIFFVNATGNVGIGTTSPDSLLTVNGGINAGSLRLTNLATSPGTKQLRINAQGQISLTDTLIDAGGTVTSIATNNGSGITGGTITTTGTLAIDTLLISTRAWRQKGVDSVAALVGSGYVPYVGATDTLNMGQFGIKSKYLEFDTSTRAITDRTLQWSNDNGTLAFGMTNGGTIEQEIGLQQFARVKNIQGSQINKGQVVYLAGASGDRAAVKLADNRNDSTSSKTLGIAVEDIPNSGEGFIGTFGTMGGLNLSTYTPGDILYLDSIPGGLTSTKPQAPYHLVFIGVVERANSGNGLLFTNPQNGYELEELHNVKITSPVRNNAILVYDSTARLWVDTTISQAGLAVTNIATNASTGILGGPITTTGTISADTLLLSTRAWRQKGIDSVAALANTKVDGSGISNYLSRWTGTKTIDTSQFYQNGENIGLGTITPGGRLAIVDTGSFALKINYNSASTDANNNAALYAENNGLSSYVAILNEKTTNNTGGQYPILIESSLTTGTAQSGMATGIHFGTPDDAGNRKVTQLALRTTNAAAANYTNRAELRLWNNGTLSTPYYLLGNGNMGLGTSTPDSNLTVVNGAYFQRGVRMSGLPTAVGTKSLRVDASGTLSLADTLTNGVSGSLISGYITKATGTSTIDTSQIYQSNGLIGIGTTSPARKLDVNGDASINGIRVGRGNANLADNIVLSRTGMGAITTGTNNIGIGTNALNANTSGNQNVSIGVNSMTSNTTGGSNVSVGVSSLFYNNASYNSALGNGALGNITTGGFNIGIGAEAGYIANNSGLNQTSSNSIYIGYDARPSLNGNTNETVIGYLGRGNGSNTTTIGNSSTTKTYLLGQLNIAGTPAGVGTKALRIDGSGNVSAADTLIDAGGTVTSVATNNGTGITGGTITTTGTLAIDTLRISTRAWRQKGIDSVAALINSNVSGTTNYVAKFTGTNTIGNSQIFDNGTNVGIGTTSPSTRLHIVSGQSTIPDLYVQGASTLQGWIGFGNSSDYSIQGGADYTAMNFRAGGSERMRITSGGNVGINTSSPSYKLQVLSSDNTYANAQVIVTSNNGNVSGGLTFGGLWNSDALNFYTQGSATSKMYISNAGNLGIGTSSPDSMLTVTQGAYLQRGVRLSGLPTGIGTKELRIDANGVVYANDTLSNDISGSGTTNYIPKFTSSSAIGNSAIYDNSGNINIGTTTSSNGKLVVNSSSFQYIAEATDVATYGYLGIGHFSNGAFIGTYAGSNSVSDILRFGTGGTERMRLTSTGLGIGTSSPSAKLDVVGDAKLSRSTATDTYLSIANSVSSFILTQSANGNSYLYNYGNYGLLFGTNATERMRLDASGNLGLGVTPSAWSVGKAIEVSALGNSIWGAGGGDIALFSNAYYNSNFIYASSNYATGYRQQDGVHKWLISSSGTAGNAISFTQAMTLDASGRLGIGVTNPSVKLDVGYTSDNRGIIKISSNAANRMAAITFYGNNAESATIGYEGGSEIVSGGVQGDFIIRNNLNKNIILTGGNVGIGTTSPNNLLQLTAAAGSSHARWTESATTVGFVGGANGIISGLNGSFAVRGESGLVLSGAGNATTMYLNTSGNVGIGTTSPTEGKLVVANSGPSIIYNKETSVGVNSFWNASDGSIVQFGVASNHPLIMLTNNTERMRITSGGLVGIGTSNPTSNGGAGAGLLHINGAAAGAWSITHYTNGTTGTNSDDGLIVGNIGADSYLFNYENSPLIFGTNSSERMRITSGGNVGIGTTNPAVRLHAVSSSGEIMRIENSNFSTGGAYMQFTNTSGNIGYIGWGSSGNDDLYIYNQKNANMTLWTNQVERMRITSGGNVGIGTTAPDGKLDVNGTSYFRDDIVLYATKKLYLDSGSDTYLTEVSGNTMQFVTGGSERMRITSAGNTELSGSIKTAAPSGGTAKPYKLGEAGVAIGGSDGYAVKVEIDGTLYYLMTGYLPEPAPEAQAGPSSGYNAKFEEPVIKIKSDSQKVKDLEKEVAELKAMMKVLIEKK